MTATFARALSAARTPDAAFAALHAHSQSCHPVRLWTVMTLEMEAGLARRAYTSHPRDYPVSGTKPVPDNDWFRRIHDRRETFVAHTLSDIAAVFPDHEKIGALGCGAVVNLPVFLGGDLAATINLLDAEGAFPPSRVVAIEGALALPALAAIAVARHLPAPG